MALKKAKSGQGLFKGVFVAYTILILHVLLVAAMGVLVLFFRGVVNYLPWIFAGAAVIGNNRLYVVGGGLQGEVPYAEVYSVDTDTWKQFDMPMLEEGSTWRHLGVTNVETRIFAVGGWHSGAVQADNYVYEPFKHRTFLPTVGGDN